VSGEASLATSSTKRAPVGIDVDAVRAAFPNLKREVHGQPLIYFDNAASAQRPQAMLDATARYYSDFNANVHRGVHALSEEATQQFEAARDKLAGFLGVANSRDLIWTRGVTEGVNLVAQSFLRPRLSPGDEIVLSQMEHHSNIVPWQLLREQTGCKLKVIPINRRGELLLDEYQKLLTPRVKMVACVHVSNAIGTINPVAELTRMAQAKGIPVLLDGAQATPHLPIDINAIGCDFYCVSGHKMFGPTGIGALFGKSTHLEAMQPYHGGGEMIRHVTFDETTFNEAPAKFEAGTPNIAGAIGLGATVDYLQSVGMESIAAYEQELLAYGVERLSRIDGLTLIGTAQHKAAVLSFVLEGVHPHDLGTIIDHDGVAIRTGHHCAMPLMQFFEVPATARASLAFYNTTDEIDRFADAVAGAQRLLA